MRCRHARRRWLAFLCFGGFAAFLGLRPAVSLLTGPPLNPVGGPDVRLPAAYDDYRVLGRLNLGKASITDDPGPDDDDHLFNTGSQEINAVGSGVKILQRHAKTGSEGPWWPNYWDSVTETTSDSDEGIPMPVNVQHTDPGSFFDSGEDLITHDTSLPFTDGMVDEAAAVGQSILFYYRHMNEEFFAGYYDGSQYNPAPAFLMQNPSPWVCLKQNDAPQQNSRGVWLCVNSPYRDVVAQRIRSLAGKGGVGNHFDHKHNPPKGCFCGNCAQAWVDRGWDVMTGLDFSELSPEDPELIDFYSDSVRLYFEHLATQARLVQDEFMIGVKVAEMAAIAIRSLRTDVAAVADIVMTEYGQGSNHPVYATAPLLYEPSHSTHWAVAWSLLRDASYGRPPKVALDSNAQGENVTAEEIFAMAGATLTFGCASMPVYKTTGTNTDPVLDDPQRFASTHDLGDVLSPHLGRTRPAHWAGIVFSENALDLRGWNRDNAGPEALEIYREVFSPMYAAVEVCNEEGVPYGFITEHQLKEYDEGTYDYLDQFARIVCPVPAADLDPDAASGLSSFAMNTGPVFYLDGAVQGGDRWDGYDGPAVRDALKAALWNDISNNGQSLPYVLIDKHGGSDGYEVQSIALRKPASVAEADQDDDTLVMLTRRWDWATEQFQSEPPLVDDAMNYGLEVRVLSQPTVYSLSLTPGGGDKKLVVRRTGSVWTADIPLFDNIAAILVDENGDTQEINP